MLRAGLLRRVISPCLACIGSVSQGGVAVPSAPAGTDVTANGTGLGTSAGTVRVNGTAATVGAWTPTGFTITLPGTLGSGQIVATLSSGQVVSYPFTVSASVVQAAVFNGTTSQAVVASSADFQVPGADFSIALWFNAASTSGVQRLLFKGLGSGVSPTDEWFMQLNGTTLNVGFSFGAGYQIHAIATIAAGGWHLAYGGWRQGIAAFDWSLDGAAISTAGVGASGPQSTAQPVTLGSDPTGASPFSGDLQNVGFWKRTLTQPELDALWNSGMGIEMSSLSGAAIAGVGETWDLNGTLAGNVNGHTLTGTAITYTAGH